MNVKTKHITAEIICFALMLNFFYEGIYKVAYIGNYGFWITHAPLLKPIGMTLKYAVPAGEIAIAIMILIPAWRKIALYSIIIAEIIMILWVMSVFLFTGYLFWPYHALWDEPTWMQKMIFGLLLSWLAFTAILLNRNKIIQNKYKETIVQ